MRPHPARSVNKPIDRGVTVTLGIDTANSSVPRVSFSASGDVVLPEGGATALNLEIKVRPRAPPAEPHAAAASQLGRHCILAYSAWLTRASCECSAKVPAGLDDQSVSVQMFGPPNPPPPSEICPCAQPLPSGATECPDTLALMTASLVSNSSFTQRGCVPSPYWDGPTGEFMFSWCWRYVCLG